MKDNEREKFDKWTAGATKHMNIEAGIMQYEGDSETAWVLENIIKVPKESSGP
jgi:hypothetical protein